MSRLKDKKVPRADRHRRLRAGLAGGVFDRFADRPVSGASAANRRRIR